MFDRQRLSILSLTAILAACGGGGGGGGGGGSDNSLRIGALSPTEVTATWADSGQGQRPVVTLSASYTGTPSGSVYVVVEDPDKTFTSAVPIVGSTQASVELSPSRTDMAAGHYTRPLVVHVCKDASCTAEYAGSPQTVRKDILIESLVVTPAKLQFTAPVAGAAAQSITIKPPAGVFFSFDASGSVTYKTPDGNISSTSRRVDDVFDVSRTMTGLDVKPMAAAAGQYTWTTYITGPGYVRRAVEVVYDVAGQSGEAFTVLTPQVADTTVGNSLGSVNVDVKINIQPTETRISVAGTPDPVDHGWLQLYDTVFIDGGMRYRFHLKRCGQAGLNCLAPGVYSGSVTLAPSAFGATWRYTVPVTYTVR